MIKTSTTIIRAVARNGNIEVHHQVHDQQRRGVLNRSQVSRVVGETRKSTLFSAAQQCQSVEARNAVV